MDDLITWLCAQLDEDERVARALHAKTCGHDVVVGPDAACDCDWQLAEVEAMRQLLNLSAKTPAWTEGSAGATAVVGDMLRLLALPYADRPGYREEWRS